MTRWLGSSAAPLWIGLASLALTWWVWGRWAPLPAIHDEAAYLLQARIFATGHWAAPAPPLPEPFEEFHVLVHPVLAAKYHPGQALAMVPGVLVGWPLLEPVLAAALGGALVFAFARRLAGPAVAGLTWLLWLLAPINLRWRSSYLSQVTTPLLWVAALYALHRWSRGDGRRWLTAVSLAVVLCMITRPLTGLVLAAVVLAVALVQVRKVGRRADLVLPLALGLVVPLVLGLWAFETTGDVRLSPRALYTRQYMPWDWVGFGLDSTPPALSVTPELRRYAAGYDSVHINHTPAHLPGILAGRVWAVLCGSLGAGVVILLLCLVVGALERRAEARVGLGAVGLLFLAHLIFAHLQWAASYYIEAQPILAFFAAAGVMGICGGAVPASGERTRLPGRLRRAMGIAVGALATLSLLASVAGLPSWRHWHQMVEAPVRQFRETLEPLAGSDAVVFVRYRAEHNPDLSLIANPPDVATARLWVVQDLGPATNGALMSRAGARAPWLFDECTGLLSRWDPAGPAAPADRPTGCSWPKPT